MRPWSWGVTGLRIDFIEKGGVCLAKTIWHEPVDPNFLSDFPEIERGQRPCWAPWPQDVG